MKTMEFSKNNGTSSTVDHPAQKPIGPASLPLGRPARILVVDDDAAVCAALTDLLCGEHYEVVSAANSKQAIRHVLTASPDLVLLDLNLTGPDGWAAFASMEKRRPFLPVIVITALPNQFDRAVGLGIDALMEKPLDFPRLLAAIAHLLSETETERQARLTSKYFVTWNLNTSQSLQCQSIRRPKLKFRPGPGHSPLNE